MQEARVKPPAGFFPYPPVTNRHLEWVEKNKPTLLIMSAMPDVTKEHRARVAAHIAKLFMLYTPSLDKTIPEDRLQQEIQRRRMIAESFIADLCPYPEWAVIAGIAEFRKKAEARWAPKAPGELLVFVSAELAKARRALAAAERVEMAEQLGRNIDKLAQKVDSLQDQGAQAKEVAEMALSIMGTLERSCDIFIDTVARGLHDRCSTIWNAWRRDNPLPTKEK